MVKTIKGREPILLSYSNQPQQCPVAMKARINIQLSYLNLENNRLKQHD